MKKILVFVAFFGIFDKAFAQNTSPWPSTGAVGIGTTSPVSLLSVGSSSQFQVNASGSIVAATGITSSGDLTLSTVPATDPATSVPTLLTYGTAGKIMKYTPGFVSTNPLKGVVSSGFLGDMNDIAVTSVGFLSSTATNLPTGSPGGVWTAALNNMYTSQLAMSRSGNSLFWRGLNNGVWGAWYGVTLGGSFSTAGGNNIKLTSTGTTDITLPITGTLTTLAGNETLTNKTLTSPVIANLAPVTDFSITQSSVVPFTSVYNGATANTLYLKAGNVGIGTTDTKGYKLGVNGM